MIDKPTKKEFPPRLMAEKEQINVLGRATLRFSDFIPAAAKAEPKAKKDESL